MSAEPIELLTEPAPNPFADLLRAAIADGDEADRRHISVSTVGGCREYARLLASDTPFSDVPDKAKARHGTWLHEPILRRLKTAYPHLLVDLPDSPLQLRVTLPSGSELPGRPDIVDPHEPSVTDAKTVDDAAALALVAKTGPTVQQNYQRHLYYAAAHQAGLVPAEGTVRNVWLARTGTDRLVVDEQPFDPAVLLLADEWIADVVYAQTHGEQASKDKPYVWCAEACPFFTECRGGDSPEPEITDPHIVDAVERYKQAKAQAKELELIAKGAAKLIPDGTFARVGDFSVRSTWINPSLIDAYERAGYWRLDIRGTK